MHLWHQACGGVLGSPPQPEKHQPGANPKHSAAVESFARAGVFGSAPSVEGTKLVDGAGTLAVVAVGQRQVLGPTTSTPLVWISDIGPPWLGRVGTGSADPDQPSPDANYHNPSLAKCQVFELAYYADK